MTWCGLSSGIETEGSMPMWEGESGPARPRGGGYWFGRQSDFRLLSCCVVEILRSRCEFSCTVDIEGRELDRDWSEIPLRDVSVNGDIPGRRATVREIRLATV